MAMEHPLPQDMDLDTVQDTPNPLSPCLEGAIPHTPLTSTHPQNIKLQMGAFNIQICYMPQEENLWWMFMKVLRRKP